MKLFAAGILALGACTAGLSADEGMWLFTDPPKELLKEVYSFEPSQDWLDHLQKSSVRFNSGGSGSFVSANGLILTNHHVGREHVYALSTPEHNYTEDGFYAATPEAELPVPGLELNVLQSIEDVTARVNEAVSAEMTPEDANAARRARMAEIESESLEATGLRSDVVTLYRGGAYHLYRYKRYTDIRLVMAPEDKIGYYGGDPDNFDYPRYTLDFTFFRAWEDGKPAVIENHLKWADASVNEGDLVLVSGHPGRTDRLLTYNMLQRVRDLNLPANLQNVYRIENALSVFSMIGPEQARRAQNTLFGAQNWRKNLNGQMNGLLGEDIMRQKLASELRFKADLLEHPELADAMTAFDRIDAALLALDAVRPAAANLESSSANWSQLFDYARTLLRAGDELPKPSGERLREFRESNLQSMTDGLFAAVPVYEDVEALLLENYLVDVANELGADHPVVKAMLAGMTPEDRAAALVAGTKLLDPEVRKQLWEGGAEAVKAANDPMIELARVMDEEARAAREVSEAQNEVISQALGDIARARFALYGSSVYPDATFTLRLSVGTVQGVKKPAETLPWCTTFGGMLEVADSQDRYALPEVWQERGEKLDASTPLNFLSTNDIIGGNSGSPAVNRDGELIGLVFDGTLDSLTWDFQFDDTYARTINVDAQAIVDSLDTVYQANELVSEIRKGSR